MKFHLVKLLLFLSLAVSFVLLLKEDISRVQDASCKELRREWQWPMQIQCISYKACSAEAKLLAAQNAAGSEAWPQDVPTGEAPFAATGRWERSTPCTGSLVLPVPHGREWSAMEEGLDPLTHQEGSERPNAVINLECVTPDLAFLKSHFAAPGPHSISRQGAECLFHCQLPHSRACDFLFCPGLFCKLSLMKIQQGNIRSPGRLGQGLATPELVRKVGMEGNFHWEIIIGIFSKKNNNKKKLFCLKTEKGPQKHFAGRNGYMAIWTVPGFCALLSSVHKTVTDL